MTNNYQNWQTNIAARNQILTNKLLRKDTNNALYLNAKTAPQLYFVLVIGNVLGKSAEFLINMEKFIYDMSDLSNNKKQNIEFKGFCFVWKMFISCPFHFIKSMGEVLRRGKVVLKSNCCKHALPHSGRCAWNQWSVLEPNYSL